MAKNTKIEIRLTEEEKQKYQLYAQEQGFTLSALIRQILNNLIEQNKEEE